MDTLIRILEVAIGVGLIIFVHELGHFLAAKYVGIRVERFSLGFPPRLFGFRYGDTDYCLSAIPLGGYVKMAGEGPDDGDYIEPDSFAAKTVGQRALVISAGVIMNVVFAVVGFLVAFKVGVQMDVPAVGGVQPGSAAEGLLERGDVIVGIDGHKPLDFFDVQMAAALAGDEGIELRVRRGGVERDIRVRPRREIGEPAQRLGILPIEEVAAVESGSAAESAGLRPRDRILAVAPRERIAITLAPASAPSDGPRPTEPDASALEVARKLADTVRGIAAVVAVEVEALPRDAPGPRVLAALAPGARADDALATATAIARAMATEAGLATPTAALLPEAPTTSFEEVSAALEASASTERSLTVWREGALVDLAITPAPRPVKDFGIELSTVPITSAVSSDAPADEGGLEAGDIVRSINGEAATLGTIVERVKAIAASDNPVIHLQVERDGKARELTIHPAKRTSGPVIGAQFGAAVVGSVRAGSPAAAAGIEPGAVLLSVGGATRLSQEMLRQRATQTADGAKVAVSWRAGADERKAEIAAEVLPGVFYGDIGIEVALATFVPEAPGLLEPLRLGFAYTWINIERVLLTLGGMFASRIDTSTLGGPITIADQAFQVTQRGLGTLLYFLCMISVNLAVLNILPVPILDGGHLVFLIVERIKGSPVSLHIQIRAQQVGMLLVLFLILFVTKNDIARLIAG